MMSTPKKKLPLSYIGVSITASLLEVAVFSKNSLKIDKGLAYPLPSGIFNEAGDEILDVNALSQALNSAMNQLKVKNRLVHVSIPGTLFRMTEMLRMSPKELYVSLSSEAERYKVFDNTEAIVDFVEVVVADRPLAANMHRVVFGAIRKDTLQGYRDAFTKAKIKIASIDLEPLNVLRGMAGSLVLDSLVQQIGPTAYWGVIFVERDRVRLSIWQGNSLIELREVQMDTRDLAHANPDNFSVTDLMEEINRTSKSATPSIWLTYNMPGEMDQVLTDKLGIPVRPCFIGPSIQVEIPALSVSTAGSSMRSDIPFPFDFDLSSSQRLYAQSSSKGGKGKPSGPDMAPEKANMALIGGVICMAITLFVYCVLLVMNNLVIGGQIGDLTSKKATLEAEKADLEMKISQNRGTYDIQTFAIDTKQKAKIRNTVFTKLIDDLREKTPANVWISEIKVVGDDTITVAGKALEHQSVLDFAKAFDDVPYAENIGISKLSEGSMGLTPVYLYNISGKVKLAPEVLQSEASPAEASPDGQTADPAAGAENNGAVKKVLKKLEEEG